MRRDETHRGGCLGPGWLRLPARQRWQSDTHSIWCWLQHLLGLHYCPGQFGRCLLLLLCPHLVYSNNSGQQRFNNHDDVDGYYSTTLPGAWDTLQDFLELWTHKPAFFRRFFCDNWKTRTPRGGITDKMICQTIQMYKLTRDRQFKNKPTEMTGRSLLTVCGPSEMWEPDSCGSFQPTVVREVFRDHRKW